MPTAEGNVGVALGLVCGAGAATALGSAVVFFPSLVKLASRRVLAASLGLSAGVMTYVSFVEIFMKSVEGFADAGLDPDHGYIYATISFFGGVLIMLLVDVLVKFLSGEHHHHDDIAGALNEKECAGEKKDHDNEPEMVAPHCVGCSDDPVGELNEWQQRADEEIEGMGDGNTKTSATIGSTDIAANNDANKSEGNRSADSLNDNESQREATGNKLVEIENAPPNDQHEQKKLVKMGLSTALAIAIHNFPEGLATFVAALDDPQVGAVLAIAIGIHNIPEGLCVALPIYYATGNRWKAFMWGCLSGASEPLAALLGWAVLANAMSDYAYAILFGLVSGMMVIISLKELIPTAHRYDPEDTVVTYSLIGGMFIIALSLVMFKL